MKAEESKWTYEEQSIYKVLADYANIIYTNMKKLTKTNIIQHTIHLLNLTLIIQECHLIDQKDRNWLKKKLDELLKKGIIRELINPYTTLIIIIDKKDGSWRICLDFRKTNKVTKKNQYPILRQTEIFVSFEGAGWFILLDLASRY